MHETSNSPPLLNSSSLAASTYFSSSIHPKEEEKKHNTISLSSYLCNKFIKMVMMDLINSVLNWVVPPASLVMLAFSWPTLTFINTCEWLYYSFYAENMLDKVVVITGASSGIGEEGDFGRVSDSGVKVDVA
ncbi:hypothetical protein Tco_0880723 [Tanacetum coccineum]